MAMALQCSLFLLGRMAGLDDATDDQGRHLAEAQAFQMETNSTASSKPQTVGPAGAGKEAASTRPSAAASAEPSASPAAAPSTAPSRAKRPPGKRKPGPQKKEVKENSSSKEDPKNDIAAAAKKAPYKSVIHMFGNKKLPIPFNSCALVGSSSLMIGLKMGTEISKHDSIIRVNRIPNETLSEDFGKLTHILFVNRFTLSAQMKVDVLGGGSISCTAEVRKCRRRFRAMVFKGSGPDRPWQPYSKYMERFPFPIGHQRNENARIATRMPIFRLGLGHVTSGFMGFLAFTPLCNSMTLYGFGGLQSADGHSEKRHYLKGEHQLLRKAASGILSPQDLAVQGEDMTEEARWLFSHFKRMKGRITVVDIWKLRQERGLQ